MALRLRDNGLAGSIPTAFGNLTGLKALNLGSNLTGPIRPGLDRVTGLHLPHNGLTGPRAWTSTGTGWPARSRRGWGTRPALRGLALGANALTGPIPDALGSLTDWLATIEFNGKRCRARRGASLHRRGCSLHAVRAGGSGRNRRDRSGDRPHGRRDSPKLRGERGGPPPGTGDPETPYMETGNSARDIRRLRASIGRPPGRVARPGRRGQGRHRASDL